MGVSLPGPRRKYTRDQLMQLNIPSRLAELQTEIQLDEEIRRDDSEYYTGLWRNNIRKRGRRGGVKLWLRHQQLNRLTLPSVIFGNAQSLRNKLDELQGNARFLQDFKNCCVMAFTESWCTERDNDNNLYIQGFGIHFRQDRNLDVTRKSRGGGVCLYINKRYCTSAKVRESLFTPDVELLSVSLRPFYLPRGFPQIFITTVYIPPKANPTSSISTIVDVVQNVQNISPEAPHFVLGDFNHVSLKKSLKTFYQYVTCPTRREKTLDLCYGTIKAAFKSVKLPPLGSAELCSSSPYI